MNSTSYYIMIYQVKCQTLFHKGKKICVSKYDVNLKGPIMSNLFGYIYITSFDQCVFFIVNPSYHIFWHIMKNFDTIKLIKICRYALYTRCENKILKIK